MSTGPSCTFSAFCFGASGACDFVSGFLFSQFVTFCFAIAPYRALTYQSGISSLGAFVGLNHYSGLRGTRAL